ncbi:hypothetical protein [Curtobacterium sp. PhB146]|nr:hypothetical protein [Curtobacterium sp. PhB146]
MSSYRNMDDEGRREHDRDGFEDRNSLQPPVGLCSNLEQVERQAEC